MDELEKEIGKVAADIYENNISFDLLIQEQISELLNRGAEIQREIDAIYFVMESFCIDDFGAAKEYWESLKNSKKDKKS